MPIPHIIHTGKSTMTFFTYIPITHHSWTTNPEHSRLTGEERLCHYECTAYKVEKDEKGKYVLIPSKPVDGMREAISNIISLKLKENYTKNEIYDYIFTIKDYNIKNEKLKLQELQKNETDVLKKAEIAQQIMKLKMMEQEKEYD